MPRRLLSFALLACLALAPGCKPEPEGSPKIIVIGAEPKLADPATGPLPAPDAAAALRLEGDLRVRVHERLRLAGVWS